LIELVDKQSIDPIYMWISISFPLSLSFFFALISYTLNGKFVCMWADCVVSYLAKILLMLATSLMAVVIYHSFLKTFYVRMIKLKLNCC